jgi:putative transposase
MEGFDLEDAAKRVATLLQVSVADVWQRDKRPKTVQARNLLCYWATKEMGITATAVSTMLGVSVSAVSRCARRGEELATEKGWQLQPY